MSGLVIGSPKNFVQHVRLIDLEAILEFMAEIELASSDVVNSFKDGESYEALEKRSAEVNEKIKRVSTAASYVLKKVSLEQVGEQVLG